MKLTNIYKEIISEGPLDALRNLLGSKLPQAERSLLAGAGRLFGNRVTNVASLSKLTDAELNQALKTAEFKAYRASITAGLIAQHESDINRIIKSFDVTTKQGRMGAKAAIANKLQVKNAFADDIFNSKVPKPKGGGGSTGGGNQGGGSTGGGSNLNLTGRLDTSQIMDFAESIPSFSHLLETKKGLRGKLENYININFPNGATSDELLEKLRPYFVDAANVPNKPKSKFLLTVGRFFGEKDGWKFAKDSVKWAIAISVIGIIANLWTVQEALQELLCRFPKSEKWRTKFGCDGPTPTPNKDDGEKPIQNNGGKEKIVW